MYLFFSDALVKALESRWNKLLPRKETAGMLSQLLTEKIADSDSLQIRADGADAVVEKEVDADTVLNVDDKLESPNLLDFYRFQINMATNIDGVSRFQQNQLLQMRHFLNAEDIAASFDVK